MLNEGMTYEEAFGTVCQEKLQSLGEDMLVGGLSGAGMSSAAASPAIVEKGIDGIRNISSKNTTQEADTTTNPSVTPTKAVNVPNGQRQAPTTLEQAAMDVVASRNATQTTENEPISRGLATEDSLPTKEGKTPANVRKGMSRGIPLAERLEAQSRSNEAISAEDVQKATGLGEYGSKLIAEIANADGVTFRQAERAVKTAYMAGFADVDSAKVDLITDTQIDAFYAGKKDRVMQDLSAKESANQKRAKSGMSAEEGYNFF